jgi:tetratricopeptide (TPR) repeat protein
MGILDEYDDTSGFVLWVTVRDAEVFARATAAGSNLFHSDPAERGHLIESLEPAQYGPIQPALHMICGILTDPPPRDEIAAGCEEIAGWSEGWSKLQTAIEYAQVASLAVPSRANYAVHTARLLRMRAEYDRAVGWFEHGIYLAKAEGDWAALAQAYSGLGCLYMQRGSLPRARRVLLRSLRVAREKDLHERVAAAYHNLFAVEAISENWDQAEKYAQRALKWYPEGAKGVPRLARDLAFRWIQRGCFERALPLALEVLEHFNAPADRALAWSDIARAAAGAGNAEQFETAWATAWVAVKAGSVDPFGADILLNLTHAAAFRGDETRAAMTGREAIKLARERKEAQTELEAEAVLDSLRSTRVGQPRNDELAPLPDQLSRRFVSVLRAARAAR